MCYYMPVSRVSFRFPGLGEGSEGDAVRKTVTPGYVAPASNVRAEEEQE